MEATHGTDSRIRTSAQSETFEHLEHDNKRAAHRARSASLQFPRSSSRSVRTTDEKPTHLMEDDDNKEDVEAAVLGHGQGQADDDRMETDSEFERRNAHDLAESPQRRKAERLHGVAHSRTLAWRRTCATTGFCSLASTKAASPGSDLSSL